MSQRRVIDGRRMTVMTPTKQMTGHYIGKKPVAHTPEGWPVFLYVDETSRARFVTAPPKGAPYFSDSTGRPVHTPTPRNSAASGAILGGLVGALFGGPAALAGVVIGALIGGAAAPRKGQR